MSQLSEGYIKKIKEIMNHVSSIEDLAKELGVAHSTADRYRRYVKEYERNGATTLKIPKILLFDIETVMMKGYFWNGKYKQTISDEQIIDDWNTVAWAAKWLFSSDIMCDVQTPEEAINRDDLRLLEGIWNLMDEADILIAHNGDRFDVRKLNSRFIEHGFLPPSPYRTIDTLKVAKRHFAFSSYALPFICSKLGVEGKFDTRYSLWKECLDGDEAALEYMSKYNVQDVKILEEVYLKFRPWIKSHPNLALYMEVDEEVCSNCGSVDLIDKGKYYTTNVNLYKSLNCENCGNWVRRRQSETVGERNKYILMPTAR